MNIFLDTNALNAFTGISKKDAQIIHNLLEQSCSSIRVCHLQVDERYAHISKWNEKAEKIIYSFRNKGLVLNQIPSKISVTGVSRIGMSEIADGVISKIYDELVNVIENCEKKNKEKKNIMIDAMIGVTSIGNEIFITCDCCLAKSLKIVLDNAYPKYDKIFNIKKPEIIYIQPNTKNIVKKVKDILAREII